MEFILGAFLYKILGEVGLKLIAPTFGGLAILEQIKQRFIEIQQRINLRKFSHKESINKYYELLEKSRISKKKPLEEDATKLIRKLRNKRYVECD